MDEQMLPQTKEKGGFFKRLYRRLAASQYTYLAAAFLLPFTIMLGVYACLQTHPFGNNSILTLDFQAQYIYYYEEIRSLLLNGGSWLYSWKRTLGGEFMGILAYYMGSPFNLLLVLFPKKNIADAVMFIQLCKIGMMGLNFGIYLHKTRKPGEMKTVAFSIMYALCAYSVVQTIDPMWLDALVFLPMLILGLESLVRRKKVILYILSLTLIFVSNYYMGYMCGIFTFLYFLYYYFMVRPEVVRPTEKDKTPQYNLLHSYGFNTFLRFAGCTAFALALSVWMLYPAWYSLQFGKIGFVSTDFSAFLRFDFLDLFIKMLPGTYDSVNRLGTPMIYCGIVVLILMPVFYISKSVPKRQKIAATGMFIALIASFMINTLDLVWHGFSAPNWLNYRYSYVFSFFILIMACDALRGFEKIKTRVVAGSAVFVGVMVLLIQKLNITFQQGDTKTVALSDTECILLSVVLVAAYGVVLGCMTKKQKESSASFALAAVVCVELFVSSLLSLAGVHEEVGLTRYNNYTDSNGNEVYSSYNGGNIRIQDTVNDILEADKSFYRMESMVYRKLGGVNEPMAFGFNGISHSTSTLNANIIRMMYSLGYSSDSHWTKYLGGTPVSDALLGIKYVITKDDGLDPNIFTVAAQEKEGYQCVVSDDMIYALRNTKALSIAYGVSESVIEDLYGTTYPPYLNALDYQNIILSSMLSGTGVSGNVFKGIAAGLDVENCTRSTFNQIHEYYMNGEKLSATNPYYAFESKGEGAAAIFDFTSPVNGTIYFDFPAAKFGKTCKIYVNGRYLSDYFNVETACIMKLGDFKKGDAVSVKITLDNDALYLSKASKYFFYYTDYSVLNDAFSALESAQMDIEDYGNRHLKGTIDLPKGQELIFTSIPYDVGWNVYIDGKKAETIQVLDSLLAVKSTEGFHEIEFRYMPKGYAVSFIVTGIAIALFILFVLWLKCEKFRKLVYKKVLKKTYPENKYKEDASVSGAPLILPEGYGNSDEEDTDDPEDEAEGQDDENFTDGDSSEQIK